MTRRRLIRVLALAAVAVVLVTAGAGVRALITVQDSKRPAADRRAVLDSLPAGVDYLTGSSWQRGYREVYGDPAAETLVYERPGEASTTFFEVSEKSEPYQARLHHWRKDRAGASKENNPRYFREITAGGLHADNAVLFCTNIQRSATDDYEDCAAWGYWARYGQFTLYLSSRQESMGKAAFLEIVATVDGNMDRALG